MSHIWQHCSVYAMDKDANCVIVEKGITIVMETGEKTIEREESKRKRAREREKRAREAEKERAAFVFISIGTKIEKRIRKNRC